MKQSLTPREREIFNFLQNTTSISAKYISEHLEWLTYHNANRMLNKMYDKGYLRRTQEKFIDGYHYYVPSSYKSDSLTIPFKKELLPLEDALFYLSQNTAGANDFEKFGTLISSAIYHLVYRQFLLKAGQPPVGPSPVEIKSFLEGMLKLYKEFIQLIQSIIYLPIYGEDGHILEYFSEINRPYLEHMEEIITGMWSSGLANPGGVKDRFSKTLKEQKERFRNIYGKGISIYDEQPNN